VLYVTHERLDGGEPQVARGSAVAALLFEMGQEGDDQRCVEVFDR
jgi:hypothetical protein